MYAHVYIDRVSYMDMYMNDGWIMGDDDDNDNDDDDDGDDDDDDDAYDVMMMMIMMAMMTVMRMLFEIKIILRGNMIFILPR